MKIEQTINVIEKKTSLYNIEGKNITSRSVRALVEGRDIFDFRFSEDKLQLFDALPLQGEARVVISITSPKEKVKVEIVELLKSK